MRTSGITSFSEDCPGDFPAFRDFSGDFPIDDVSFFRGIFQRTASFFLNKTLSVKNCSLLFGNSLSFFT